MVSELKNNTCFTNFFTKTVHHKNCLMAYLTQNVYELGVDSVTRSRRAGNKFGMVDRILSTFCRTAALWLCRRSQECPLIESLVAEPAKQRPPSRLADGQL